MFFYTCTAQVVIISEVSTFQARPATVLPPCHMVCPINIFFLYLNMFHQWNMLLLLTSPQWQLGLETWHEVSFHSLNKRYSVRDRREILPILKNAGVDFNSRSPIAPWLHVHKCHSTCLSSSHYDHPSNQPSLFGHQSHFRCFHSYLFHCSHLFIPQIFNSLHPWTFSLSCSIVLNYNYPEHGILMKILCLIEKARLIHFHLLFMVNHKKCEKDLKDSKCMSVIWFLVWEQGPNVL